MRNEMNELLQSKGSRYLKAARYRTYFRFLSLKYGAVQLFLFLSQTRIRKRAP